MKLKYCFKFCLSDIKKLQSRKAYVNFLRAVISGNGQSKFSIALALHSLCNKMLNRCI